MAARKDGGGNGSKSDKLWRDAIHRAVKRSIGEGDLKKLEKLAEVLVEKALDGDIGALKEIGDRLDGRAVQGVQALDKDGKPDNMRVEVLLVAGIKDKS